MKNLVVVFILILMSLGVSSQTAMDFYNAGNDKLDRKDFKGALEEYSKAIQLTIVSLFLWLISFILGYNLKVDY